MSWPIARVAPTLPLGRATTVWAIQLKIRVP
jgi:hypothetical protein